MISCAGKCHEQGSLIFKPWETLGVPHSTAMRANIDGAHVMMVEIDHELWLLGMPARGHNLVENIEL